MIQDYQILSEQIKSFPANTASPIQKIFSTTRYLAISMRSPGKTYWLYIGRGGGHEGIWYSEQAPESYLRVHKDQLLEFVRKYISGGIFHSLELDQKDRILKFNYNKWGRTNSFYYFYRGRESIFGNNYFDGKQEIFFCSYYGKLEEKILFNHYDKLGRTELGVGKPRKLKLLEDLLNLEKNQRLLNNKKRTKFLEKKSKNIEGDLSKMLSIPLIEKKLEKWSFELNSGNDVAELNSEKILINGFRFKFSKEMSLYKRIDLIYKKIKKLKDVKVILTNRLKEANLLLNEVKNSHLELSQKIIKPIWNRKKIRNTQKTNIDFEEFLFEGFKIAIGKNAKSNDGIRKGWAKKEDWWFHIENRPSAHAYVKSISGSIISMDLIQEVSRLLKEFTKLETSEIPLIYTQVKNLKGVKGIAGSVFFKKEKRITCYL